MEKFSKMRISHGSSTILYENVKKWFEYEHELCDWIINLWLYSKYIGKDKILEMYAFVNLELIEDNLEIMLVTTCIQQKQLQYYLQHVRASIVNL